MLRERKSYLIYGTHDMSWNIQKKEMESNFNDEGTTDIMGDEKSQE